jgi:hypothetical protein
MVKEILRKWFGLPDPTCATCEVLRELVASSEKERRELLTKLLEKDKPEPLIPPVAEDLRPFTPQFVPWRVKQQMLEAEDRKKAELMRNKANEIEELEKELGVK